MVHTFIRHVLAKTVDLLHGDSQPQLGLEQQLLTGQAQRNVRVCLNHPHTYVSRVRVTAGCGRPSVVQTSGQ